MAKREEHEEHENLERWLVSYADMLTLMMAFFIMLFAMSQLDLKKMEEFKKGAAEALGASTNDGSLNPISEGMGAGGGVFNGGFAPTSGLLEQSANALQQMLENFKGGSGEGETGPVCAEGKTETDTGEECSFGAGGPGSGENGLENARSRIERGLGALHALQNANVRLETRGLVVTIVTDNILFELGSATLGPGSTEVIGAIAAAIKEVPNQIVVEGHTDNLPLHSTTQYRDNWDLSAARAASVVQVMIEQFGLQATRFRVAGYADTRPIADNLSPEGRAKNRRVEIVIMDTKATGKAEQEHSPTPKEAGHTDNKELPENPQTSQHPAPAGRQENSQEKQSEKHSTGHD